MAKTVSFQIKGRQAEYANTLRELHAAKVAADKAKVLTERVKTMMLEDGIDRVEAGGFIATTKDVETKSVDTKAMQADIPDVCARYTRTTVSTRLYTK